MGPAYHALLPLLYIKKVVFFPLLSAPEAIRLKLVMGRVAPIKKSAKGLFSRNSMFSARSNENTCQSAINKINKHLLLFLYNYHTLLNYKTY